MRHAVVRLALGLVLSAAPSVRAAEFGVDSTQDAPDASPGDGVCATAGGTCTLRASIQEANALPGHDVVWLPDGDYSLTLPGAGEDAGATGDLDVTDGLTLLGAGPDRSRVDGMGLDRVFHVASPAPVELVGLAIRGGANPEGEHGAGVLVSDPPGFVARPGGALFEEVAVLENTGMGRASELSSAVEVDYGDGGGDVVFVDSSVSDNAADGLVALGYFAEVELLRTRVEANSGEGVWMADMGGTIEESVFAKNGAAGILSGGDNYLSVRRSTLSRNEAEGLSALGYGGVSIEESAVVGNGGVGLFQSGNVPSDSIRVTNSTVTGNRGGGIWNTWGELVVSHSTVVGNVGEGAVGGIRVDWTDGEDATVSLRNSIVAGHGGGAPDCVALEEDEVASPASFPSDGHNRIGDATGCAFAAAEGDRAGSAAEPLDPGLGPLGRYGGPTASFALLPRSPALDAVPESDCVYLEGDGAPIPLPGDQRGVARPQAGACDAGSFEALQREVEVDVKPWRRRNVVRLLRPGAVNVALLSQADFDATAVDPASLRFGPDGAMALWTWALDVDRDGRRDLVARFRTEESGIALGDGEACLAGLSAQGEIVSGCDAIRTWPREEPPGDDPRRPYLSLLLALLKILLRG